MTYSLPNARAFIYQHGNMWERALFAYLFDEGSLEHLRDCLRAYKNPDGGWGHAFEHDIRSPDSNPLQLEFLLRVVADTNISLGDLLDSTPAWVDTIQNDDGSLRNPPTLLDFPHAPWWNEGGQDDPASLVGNLVTLGLATDAMLAKTQTYMQAHYSIEQIKANDWLFMAYRPYDYFFNIADYPDVEAYRKATTEHVITLAEKAPPEQWQTFFTFAPNPDSPIAQAAPSGMLDRFLDHLASGQQEDGRWKDQHDLPQWFPYTTITALLTLQGYGR